MTQIHIPGYTIQHEIGRGGMATVYLAVQESLARPVALKIMAPALAADPTFGERFLKEARTVARLTHPNILAIYDIGASGHHHYIAMEYLAGGDLKARIKRGMTPDQALAVLQQVAAALDHAHRQGFVHRDIKPENILLREDGTGVLTDFGIAKAVGSGTRMTQTGMSIGTPHYMSPEQVRGKDVDGRSDLYSLGVVFYEMLTGRVPYDAEDTIAVAYAHVNGPVPELPMGFSACAPLVDRLMAKNSEDRFADAAQLVNAIRKVRTGEQLPRLASATRVVASNISDAEDRKTEGGRSARRAGLLWGLGGAVVALVAAAGFYFAGQPSRPVALHGGGSPGAAVQQAQPKVEPARSSPPVSPPIQAKAGSTPKEDADPSPADDSAASAQQAEEAIWKAAEKAARQARIDVLLSQAAEDLQALRLTSPAGNNAFERFKAVQEMESANTAAAQGLGRVAAAYVDLAEKALNKGAFDKAEGYLSKAEQILPGLSLIAENRGRLAQARARAAEMVEAAKPIAAARERLTSARLAHTAQASQAAKLGDSFTNSLGMIFVYITPGSFNMGSPDTEIGRSDDETLHRVTLSRGYWLQTTEVTQAHWRALMSGNPSENSRCDQCPVENVSWEDTQVFIAKLNQVEGKSYALPTEAQWEYAARAGSRGRFCFGDSDSELDEYAWYGSNSGKNAIPVALKTPNAWGLHDMHGNVWEWCQDWYGMYPTGAVTDAVGPASGRYRVFRGGSNFDISISCRSAYRRWLAPDDRVAGILGFRLTLSQVR